MSPRPPVTLVLEDGKGKREAYPLPGPGGKINIAVGDPERHGAVWTIKAGRKKCDVYVFIRSIGGYQKVSWHPESPDASWWCQWTSEFSRTIPQITDRRVIDAWPHPGEVGGDTGWAKGFSAWTRHQDVVPVPDGYGPQPADTLWVPPPAEGYAAGIHIVIARPEDLTERSARQLRWVELSAAFPFAGFTLADRRVVLVIVSRSQITDESSTMVENALARMSDEIHTRLQQSPVGVPRMLLWARDADGHGQAWDVAVPPPQR